MKVVIAYAIIFAGLVILFLISEFYMMIRKRLNTPIIGVEILLDLLNKDDYVCISGKVMQFSHFANNKESLNILAPPSDDNKTLGGELAFKNNSVLGYVYYYPSAMTDCDFIFGKYGLKWARNKAIANTTTEQINKFRYG